MGQALNLAKEELLKDVTLATLCELEPRYLELVMKASRQQAREILVAEARNWARGNIIPFPDMNETT